MQIHLTFPFRLISKDNEKIQNKQGRYFLSKKFKDWEKKVKEEALLQYRYGLLMRENLSIQVFVNYTNKVHPDCTNLYKGLCDALQEVVYFNDRQIKEAYIKVIENAPQDSFSVMIQT